MLDTRTAAGWRGHELIDRDGDKIGTVGDVYLDRETEQPEWITVKTGLFGIRETFVPIRDATSEGEIVRVPFEKSHVKDAPNIDPDQELTQEDERELYQHYGVDYDQERSDTQLPETGREPGQEPIGGGGAAGTASESGEASTPGAAREPGETERGPAEQGAAAQRGAAEQGAGAERGETQRGPAEPGAAGGETERGPADQGAAAERGETQRGPADQGAAAGPDRSATTSGAAEREAFDGEAGHREAPERDASGSEVPDRGAPERDASGSEAGEHGEAERDGDGERDLSGSPAPAEGERGVAVPGESDREYELSAGDRRVVEGVTTERVTEDPVGEDREPRLRLKRYVVTEELRVPVQREEVRLERDE